MKELITIGADTDNWDGSAKQTKVELKAYASKAGMEDSDVVTFTYTIDRMSKTGAQEPSDVRYGRHEGLECH